MANVCFHLVIQLRKLFEYDGLRENPSGRLGPNVADDILIPLFTEHKVWSYVFIVRVTVVFTDLLKHCIIKFPDGVKIEMLLDVKQWFEIWGV